MKKNRIIISLLFIVLSITSCSQTKNDKNLTQNYNLEKDNETSPSISETPPINKHKFSVLENDLQTHLELICNSPRRFGTAGEELALSKLVDQLKEYGYNTELQVFPVHEQTFETTVGVLGKEYLNTNPFDTESLGDATNIIATKFAKQPTNKTLYITAHYDTTKNNNGIIDNGSGVISVLQIAKIFKDIELTINIKFIFFSAEEYYRQGSRYYLSSLTEEERSNSIGCINIDMIGEENAGEIVFKTNGKRTNVISNLYKEFTDHNFEVGGSSDDLSFYNAKIPAITISNISPNKEKDIELNIDFHQIKEVTEELCYFIEYLDKSNLDKILSTSLILNEEELNMTLINNSKLKLISTDGTFIGNGYEKIISYNFLFNDKDDLQITEEINLDSIPEDLSSYNIIAQEDKNVKYKSNTWVYKINEQKGNYININYFAGVRKGTLIGNISLEEALDILKKYYVNYHIY